MINRKYYYLLLFASVFFTTTQTAYTDQVLELVTHESVPPYIWQENGKSKGIEIEIVQELFSRINQKYIIKHDPWKRALKRVETGISDIIFPAFKTEEREIFAIYPEYPIDTMEFSIFVRKDKVFKYEKAEDLKGKIIGLGRGYSAGPVFDEARKKNYFRVEETNTTENDIRKLLNGRIDCFVQQDSVGRYYIKQAGALDRIQTLESPAGNKIPTFLIISKKADIENKDLLVSRISKTLGEMWKDGTIEKIIHRYTE